MHKRIVRFASLHTPQQDVCPVDRVPLSRRRKRLVLPGMGKHVPRYFFDRTNGKVDPDLDGIELAGLDEAKHEAMAFAADTLKGADCALWDGSDVRIEVVDDARTLIFSINISIATASAI